MQSSFSELEYALKKKQTRRDRFLAEIYVVAPWMELEPLAKVGNRNSETATFARWERFFDVSVACLAASLT